MTVKTEILGRKKVTRPTLTRAVEWIAFNDEPTCMDEEVVSGFISVLLVADLFGKESHEIAKRVVDTRRAENDG